MPDEKLTATAPGTATPPAERRDEPTVVVEDDTIEVLEEPETAPVTAVELPAARVRQGRRPMLVAGAMALFAVAVAVAIGLLISEVGDTDSESGGTGPVPEDCRPVPFSSIPRPC